MTKSTYEYVRVLTFGSIWQYMAVHHCKFSGTYWFHAGTCWYIWIQYRPVCTGTYRYILVHTSMYSYMLCFDYVFSSTSMPISKISRLWSAWAKTRISLCAYCASMHEPATCRKPCLGDLTVEETALKKEADSKFFHHFQLFFPTFFYKTLNPNPQTPLLPLTLNPKP